MGSKATGYSASMMIIVASSFAFAANPTMVVHQKKGVGRLQVEAPTGEHIAPEAPVSGWIRSGNHEVTLQTSGEVLEGGLAIVLPEPTLEGELSLSLCQDGGTECRMVDVAFGGPVKGKKSVLGQQQPHDETPSYVPGRDDLAQAQAQANEQGKRVLIDFGAIWCPPCNLMAVEVLDNPAHADDLAPFVLAKLDADHPSSWTPKNHYAVGGYPTLVVTEPDGAEVDRLVGYTSADHLLSWLADLEGQAPISSLPAPAELSPDQALDAALRLARAGRADDAKPYLEVADGPDLPLARMLVDGHVDDAWLLIEQGAEGWDWVYDTLSLAKEDPELSEALAELMLDRLRHAEAGDSDVTDATYVLATVTDDETTKSALAGACAHLIQSQLSGEPERDRGHYSTLASLYRMMGAPDRGEDLLAEAAQTYPDEFTFHWALAHHYRLEDKPRQAIEPARLALKTGYGDNALRAARELALALDEAGQTEEALAVIAQAIDEAERPDEGVKVRTHRYLELLQETGDEIAHVTND